MKKVYFFSLFVIACTAAFPQALFNNNGANIYVMDGAFMIVKTDSLYNDQVAGTGTIYNQGTIVVEGNIRNDGTIQGDGDTIRLQGDWENDLAYSGNNSWVDMYGGDELITGSAITTFDNLNLGGNEVTKKQTLNSVTAGLLQLNDDELATDVNQMLVTNPSTAAITWNSGYASSVGVGMLARVTNSASPYAFPMGSPSYVNGPSIFRPLEMTPASGNSDTYGACLVKGNATADGYNVNSLDTILCKVNPNFYDRLYHTNGADPIALTMTFNPSADGDWTDEAHWIGSLWSYLGPSTAGSALGLSAVTVNNVSDFVPNPFALAIKKFNVDAGPAINLTEGQSVTLNPIIGITGNDTILWTPDIALSCDNCANPVASPSVTTLYTISVTSSSGCSASDSVIINVIGNELLLPTGFSPNSDGVNDVFHALNKNIAKIDLQVYNRWGEMVYETTDPTEGWDGTYKNQKQEIGVYVWQCTYMLIGDVTARYAKGNVTLIR